MIFKKFQLHIIIITIKIKKIIKINYHQNFPQILNLYKIFLINNKVNNNYNLEKVLKELNHLILINNNCNKILKKIFK